MCVCISTPSSTAPLQALDASGNFTATGYLDVASCPTETIASVAGRTNGNSNVSGVSPGPAYQTYTIANIPSALGDQTLYVDVNYTGGGTGNASRNFHAAPYQFQITISGVQNTASCANCATDINRQYTLTYDANQIWRQDFPGGIACGATWAQLYVSRDSSDTSLFVIRTSAGAPWARYTKSGVFDCGAASNTLSFQAMPNNGLCTNWPSTITVTPV